MRMRRRGKGKALFAHTLYIKKERGGCGLHMISGDIIGTQVTKLMSQVLTMAKENGMCSFVHLSQGGQDRPCQEGGRHGNHWSRNSTTKHPHNPGRERVNCVGE